MWIVVYASQNLSCKIALWSSLANLISNWDGGRMIMGDFSEVREAGERYGSTFNNRQPDIFNEFFSNSSLIDIPLGVFPNVTRVILEKGIPDHRPILLKEFEVDYGPTLFDSFIPGWRWKIDQGSALEEDFIHRRDSIKIIGDIERLKAKDIAQKAKVKWAIEDGDMPNHLSSGQSDYLENHFSRDENKRAIWDCGGDRAPGPNGFTFKFFTTFWDVIEADVIRFVQEFFLTGYFPKGCNSFIALILKVSNAKFVTDFHPIRLIGCQYKIVGKLLANRLSTMMGSCISSKQSAFIKGRYILDGSLVLNEVMAWYQKCKKDLMVLKVDFEKAFDSLRWDFLDLVMVKLGFGTKWHKWIFGCLWNARSSILVNGSPTCEWSRVNAHNLLCMLRCFYLIFGLKINVNKCNVLGVGVSDEEVSNLAKVISFGAAKFPLKYLGVPIGGNMARCSNWNVIIQKFSSKLSLWKARLLSVGGHLSLIMSVLGSLPTYYMSIYMMPATIQKKLEAMRNKFFIGSIYGLNIGLLFKWVWRFLCSSSDLWVRVIKNIYGDQRGIMEDYSYISSYTTWGTILSFVKRLKQKGIDLLCLCVRKIGNDVSCRFWEDTWVGNLSLKEQFLRIYQLDTGVVLSDKSDTWQWSLGVSNGYTAASVRSLVDSNILDTTLVAMRWKCSIPIKVNVFIWRLLLNKLPSRVNLDRKGIDVGSILCPICMDDVKTVNHIFFSCNMAKDLWALFANWWELDIPVCANISEWFKWIDALHISNKIGNKWGEALDIEDNFGSSFARKRLCILTKQPESILEKFKVIFKGKVFEARAKELFTWNPSFLKPTESVYTSDDESKHGTRILNDGAQNSDVESDDECNVDGVSETVFSDNGKKCKFDGHGDAKDYGPITSLWGNSNFDFVASDSLGNLWYSLYLGASISRKMALLFLDNFKAIYAHGYLCTLFGSVYCVLLVFVDVKLETVIISLYPSISALCLDRHLSDHRPILLREVSSDFGPTPFRFYQSWLRMEGFDSMVEQSWLSFSHLISKCYGGRADRAVRGNEIKAVLELCENKSPGPDGYTV
ncbi:RNA-directed DNA polymerase, eukaryota, reverse transcriptase zinc-binding domain protein [Tanacetum coccineum]